MKFSTYSSFFRMTGIALLFLTAVCTGLGQITIKAPLKFPPCPVTHIMDAMMMQDGSIWVAGENNSIYRLDFGSSEEGSWFDMRYFTNFPKIHDFRCLAQDKQGRVWVGSHNAGAAVFNGESWKTYNRDTALPGNHVYDIAVSPVSGEVALATSGGVALYDPENDTWRDLTRADGLVSDQVQSLSYGKDGELWLAYACGGVARGTSKTGYTKWETTQTKWYWDDKNNAKQPLKANGEGIPSNLCNAVLTTRDGGVALGTCSGLAFLKEQGKWGFVRGNDYLAKNKGTYETKPSSYNKNKPSENSLLNEDYITALTETDKGLLVGFRDKGAALLHPTTLRVLKRYQGDKKNPMPFPHITSFVPLPDGTILGGTYGGGLILLQRGKGEWTQEGTRDASYPSFPQYAKIKSIEEIESQIQELKSKRNNAKPPLCFFNNEDWETRGNWCERYGQDSAVLCAVNAPLDVCYNVNHGIIISGEMGWHHAEKDSLRRWVHWVNVPEKKDVLHCPDICNRIEGEWDDHAEVYPQSFDGPDVWAKVILPKGRFQVSLYFFNPNGREKATAKRDYLIEVRHSPNLQVSQDKQQQYLDIYTLQEKELLRIRKNDPIARTRVNHFTSGGVYKNFIMEGNGVYYIKVGRNNSFNTILNGIFVTQLVDEYKAKAPLPQYLEYDSVFPKKRAMSTEKTPKRETGLYQALSGFFKDGVICNQDSSVDRAALHFYRRLLSEEKKDEDLIYNLRWDLKMWDEKERDEFDKTMLASWYSLQETRPIFRSKKWAKFGPRTIDFSVAEVKMMKELEIDWKEYLPGKKTEAEENAMHDLLAAKIKEKENKPKTPQEKKIDEMMKQSEERTKNALKKLLHNRSSR